MTGGYFDRAFGNYLPDDEKYFCDKCGDEFAEDDLTEVGGEMICENCLDSYFFICDICEEHIPEEDMVDTADGKKVCQSCYDDTYSES